MTDLSQLDLSDPETQKWVHDNVDASDPETAKFLGSHVGNSNQDFINQMTKNLHAPVAHEAEGSAVGGTGVISRAVGAAAGGVREAIFNNPLYRKLTETSPEALDAVMQANPHMTIEQAQQHARRAVRGQFGKEVAKGQAQIEANSQGDHPILNSVVPGVAGSAFDPLTYTPLPEVKFAKPVAKALEPAVGKLAAKVLGIGADAVGHGAVLGGAMGAEDVGQQAINVHDKVQDKFDPKQVFRAVVGGAALGAGLHLAVSPFVEGLFRERGGDTTPPENPIETKDRPTSDTPLEPDEQAQYHSLLAKGSEQDIHDFFHGRNGPKPDPESVSRWVKYRDGVPEGFAQDEFKPQYDVEGEKVKQSAIDHINQQTADWKNAPQFEVINHVNEIADPEVRQHAIDEGADHPDALGFLGPDNKVRIFANRIDSPDTLNAVLYHEALGHYGLAQQFGDKLDSTLQTLMDRNVGQFGKDVEKWQKENPGAYNGDKVRAAEEVLANMSNNGKIKPSIADALTAHVRNFGRKIGLDLSYSDNEIRTILGMAHSAVIEGKGRNVAANGFKFMRKEVHPDDETHTLYHGSPYSNIDEFRTENLRNRTGTEGTLSFTTDPDVAKIYGHNVYKAEVSGKFGDYANPEHVQQNFKWRDASDLQQSVYKRIAEHYESLGPDVVAQKIQEAKDDLLKSITRGDYEKWENKKLWADNGWHGAWTRESGARNLIVGENAVAKKVSDTPKFMRRSDLAASKDYEIQRIEESYKATDEDYEPTVRTTDEIRRAALEAGFSASQIKDFGNTPDLSKRLFRIGAAAKVLDAKIADLVAKLDTPDWSVGDRDRLTQAVVDHHYMLTKLRDERAEIARALNLSKAVGYTRTQMGAIGEVLREQGGTLAPLGDEETFLKFARQLKQLHETNNLNGMNQVVMSLTKPNWEDYLTTLHQAMMLSGVSTHVKAPLDMMIGIGRELLDNAAALPMGAARSAINAMGGSLKEGVHPTEAAARLWGVMKAAMDAQTYRNTIQTFMNKGFNVQNPMQFKNNARIPGVSKVTDLISAQDAFFRAFATNMHLYGLAAREALEDARANGTKKDWDTILTEASNRAMNPTRGLMSEAREAADKTLLLNKNPLTEPLDRFKNTTNNSSMQRRVGAFVANFLAPFVRVEMNSLMNRVIARSPAALATPTFWKEMAEGGARADIAMVKMIMGTASIAAYWSAAEKGKITADGPDNPAKKAELEAGGWRPNASHDKGQYNTGNKLGMSLNPFDSHNATASMVANFRESYEKGANKGQIATGLKLAVLSTMKEITEMSWVSGIAPAVETFTAPNSTISGKFDKFVANEVGTMMPNLTSQAAKVIDPNVRDSGEGLVDSVVKKVQGNIPGLREKLALKHDVYGNPIQNGTSLAGQHTWLPQGNHITAGNHIDEPTDSTIKELGRLGSLIPGALVTPVQRTIKVNGESKKLTPAEFEAYQQLAGRAIVETVRDEMSRPEWAQMSDQDKVMEVKDIERDMKKAAREQLYGQ